MQFFALKASFHLRSDLITDNLPPEEYWPTTDDLSKAEDCLKGVSLDIMPSKANFHVARYYRSLCDLYIWKQQYSEAMHYLQKAQNIYDQIKVNSKTDNFDQQFKLLERLNEDEKLMKYSRNFLTCFEAVIVIITCFDSIMVTFILGFVIIHNILL